MISGFEKKVADEYNSRFIRYGAQPKSSLWFSEQRQILRFDLIIDCTNSPLDLTVLENIKAIIETRGRTLVVLVLKSDLDSLAMDWNVVPTREEAQDFISFERMQRDLGI